MAKQKSKELIDGVSIVPSIEGTANTITDSGKWGRPSAKKWVNRIISRVRQTEITEGPGRNLTRDYYEGKILSKNPIKNKNDVFYPILKTYHDALRPNLYYQLPAWYLESTIDDESFTDIDSSVLSYGARETDFDNEMKAMMSEVLLHSFGCVAYDFDADRMVSRARQVNIDDVVVDNVSSWRMRDQSWVAIRGVVNLEDAKIIFNDKDLNPTIPLKNSKGYGFSGNMRSKASYLESPDDREEVFEFWEIFAKYGQERERYYVSLNNEDDFLSIETVNPESVKGNNPVKWSKKSDWPFVLDKEDFPVEFLRMNERTTSFYPLQEMALLCPLVKEINVIFRFMSDRTKKAASAKIIFDKSISETNLESLMSSQDFDALAIKLKSGRSIRDLIEILEFPGVTQEMLQNLAGLVSVFNESSGVTELVRGGSGTGRKTAKQALIENDQLGLRVGSMQYRIDDFLRRVGRKMNMINSQLTPKEVARRVSKRTEANSQVFEKDENGNIPWDIRAKDIGRIIDESTVLVENNSARRMGSSESIGMLQSIFSVLDNMVDSVTGQPLLSGANKSEFAWRIGKEAQLGNLSSLMPKPSEMQDRAEQSMQAQENSRAEEEGNIREAQQEGEDIEMEARKTQEAAQMDEELANYQDNTDLEEFIGGE